MSVRTESSPTVRALTCVALAACLAGCASAGADPWESFNRPVFAFNDGLDRYALEPVSRGWTWITPETLRVSLDKFFKNLRFPVRFLSNLGQGELRQAEEELGRFLLNSTIGLLGLFDPATRFGLRRFDEDFGQMLGRWGVPPGPYLVLPILGPATPRRLPDIAADLALGLPGTGVVAGLNGRAIAGPQIARAREASLDFYVFVRDAYQQQRASLIRDGEPDAEEEGADDLYDLPDDLYEEPEESEH